MSDDRLTIGIIGTAGRDPRFRWRMTRALYLRMYNHARVLTEELAEEYEWLRVVSGGAAWSDHLAVNLFLKEHAEELLLHLPSEFGPHGFRPVPEAPDTRKAANAANRYHSMFSAAIRHDSLGDIQQALEFEGAESTVSAGFHARNRRIAQDAQILIAYTWGEQDFPTDGGTRHTWTCSKLPEERKIHVCLADLDPGE